MVVVKLPDTNNEPSVVLCNPENGMIHTGLNQT